MSAVADIRTAPSAIPGLVADLRRTFDSGRTRPIAWRKEQLRRLGEMLAREQDAIAGALHQDLGKSPFEGWLTEIMIVQKEIDLAQKEVASWAKPEKVSVPVAVLPGRARIVSDPLGVVLVIAPWNYPFQLLVNPLVAALAAGNCVVVKPSEVAAHTSRLLGTLIPKYLDQDAVRVVEGGVPETTALLEQRFDHILYTGNGTVGRVVMAAAAKHLTPVTLELGGKSPVIVDETADLDVAARRIVVGKFINAGQTCIAPDYVLVHKSVEEALLGRLKATLIDFYGEDPQKTSDYGRIINDRHFARLVGYLADGTIAHGGQHDAATRYLAPTLLRGAAATSKVMQDEIFGPILPIIPVDGIESAIQFITARDKPLALYVFTADKDRARRVIERTSSGGACVNDCVLHYLPHTLPFGGVGESGMGSYHGKFGFDTFSHKKSVLDNPTGIDVPLRYPPYGASKKKWINRLV